MARQYGATNKSIAERKNDLLAQLATLALKEAATEHPFLAGIMAIHSAAGRLVKDASREGTTFPDALLPSLVSLQGWLQASSAIVADTIGVEADLGLGIDVDDDVDDETAPEE